MDDPSPRNIVTSVDDVFGSTGAPAELSEIPHLRAEHGTAGYREGLSAGKASTMQIGFDEGYSLGAVVGQRAGIVLGIMEGLCAAVAAGGGEEETAHMRTLWEQSTSELAIESIFAPAWWGEDGVWKFEVRGGAEADAVTFKDVADAHPLIKKWEVIVQGEVERWRVDLGILEVTDSQDVYVAGADKPAAKESLQW